MEKLEFEQLVKNSVSKSEICRHLGLPINGHGLRKVALLIDKYNVDISHFSQKAVNNKHNRIYKIIEKLCPVCGTMFETSLGHKAEKTTCSHSCSNTFFSKLRNKPELYGYRKKCIDKWGKKCLICGYDRFVDVHHIDGNHKNDDIDNLIPLCSNHHEEIHSIKYFNEIQDCLKKYNVHIVFSPKAVGIRKVVWPTVEELVILLKTKSWSDIANQYGVSTTSVRKWVKSYNLVK